MNEKTKQKKPHKPRKKNAEDYVNNAEFYRLLVIDLEKRKPFLPDKKIKDKDRMKGVPPISDEVAIILMKIVNRLADSHRFTNYPFKDEMIADGLEDCLRHIDGFDPEKSKNPFSYYTEIAFYAFVRRIIAEKQALYVRYTAITDNLLQLEGTPEANLQSAILQYGTEHTHEQMHEYMRNFETSAQEKRQRLREYRKSRATDKKLDKQQNTLFSSRYFRIRSTDPKWKGKYLKMKVYKLY
jgi:hypothetical protein